MRQRAAFTETIASQVREFQPAFEAQVGPELAAVFAREQEDLRREGLPDGVARIGDPLPDAVLYAADGQAVSLADLLDSAAAILVFYRGSWCPYCNIALQTYQRELLPVVEAFGTRLIAISPQAPERAARAARDAGLYLDIYSDGGNRLAARLGIVTTPSADSMQARSALGIDVVGSNMDRTAAIPYPAVVVADATGTIRLIDVRVDYTSRTETCDIIDTLVAL
ncbi:AhpC/TSA family [Arthrobacter agilis]|uniref:peroxiredoxin-like family protein n=1 Tax=Arthrobacter agilis TaxID=37921 RepID=UPI000F713CD8|nr:peroxiredoxin-like family protein [Arthrobacter agilis]VDR33465.1 AhpC/TSA family [Arthrobacter agilis]